MTEASTQRRFEDLLSRVKRPARLIGGEPGSTSGFTADPGESRVVLAFPDVYEIGISNQAIQILYGIAKGADGVAVERAYLPWVDAMAEMRRERIPLLTLETWTPVASADLLGVTLQHESNFTSLLELLDLAGMPVQARDRGGDQPLVVVGGPACANFLAISPFVDAVVVGDGEQVFVEMLEVIGESKRATVDRSGTKRRLSEVEGVYVPGVSQTVGRRCVSRLDEAGYPRQCLVPLTEGVHDRAWVEVMRGCTRGCRFCQAGMWYRPVRERPPDQVMAMVEGQLLATGYQEVALASLSTTDYSGLEQVLREMSQCHPEARVSLPSLRVDSAAIKLSGLASPTGPSLTLAPEAGSQRMRDVVNKNVTEADVMGAVEEAVRSGKTTLKLYFMIGLPWEQDEDALAIADLCLVIRDRARAVMGSRANRLQLNVSVNNFIPKPFTPFQWKGMAERDKLLRRQCLIRDRLRQRGVRVSFSRVDTSYLEASLARGGENMASIIEQAWRNGARLDSWTDQFRGDAWEQAFAAAGLSAEKAATEDIALDAALPWDVVTGIVHKGFLAAEYERASRGEKTPDCRWDDCSACGVCDGGLQNVMAQPAPRTVGGAGPATGDAPAGDAPACDAPAAGVAEVAQRWRYVAEFSVSGRGRFLGHLDRAEIFRRAVRRAGGRLALSAGMRPKAILSLAVPLGLGTEGRAELAEFELAEPAAADFADKLADSLPGHMQLLSVEPYGEHRSLASRVIGASYEVAVDVAAGGSETAQRLLEAVASFAELPRLLIEERRESGTRQIDVKEYVDAVNAREQGAAGRYLLSFRAKLGPTGTARPERVVDALAALAGLDLTAERVVRTEIHLAEAGH